ncbi:MAG: UDP-N-acetylglucosamine 2-epimerase, partial [Candidatus Nanohaloarchaea archaeon]|nr:UDP-N-acetylglucosamine 2-epimerase [Candidatus Nanohaloarchaea archaeon]
IVDSATAAEKIGEPYEKEGYGIVTVHRHENIKSRKRMEKIVKIIEKSPRELIFPLHDNTRDALEKYGLLHRIQESDTVTIHELIDYPDFINMLKNADILYTDGGSMQEESLMYHVPCVILRNRTERKEGLATGINYLSKFEVEETRKKAEELVKKEKKDYKNPYGEPGVSKRIVDRLEEKLP